MQESALLCSFVNKVTRPAITAWIAARCLQREADKMSGYFPYISGYFPYKGALNYGLYRGRRFKMKPVTTRKTPLKDCNTEKMNIIAYLTHSYVLRVVLTTLFFVLPAAHANDAESGAKNPQVMMSTSVGDILVELDPAKAPKSVENFLSYVTGEFYDGTIFHRVIDGFMIQGGGFTTDFQRKETRTPIKNEANNGLKNQRYTIAMARTNAPHSATSQFFINTEDNGSLDHSGATARGWGYAVFGRVIEGVEVVNAISTTVTGPGGPFSRDTPQETIVIESVRLVGGAEDATKEEGQASQ